MHYVLADKEMKKVDMEKKKMEMMYENEI